MSSSYAPKSLYTQQPPCFPAVTGGQLCFVSQPPEPLGALLLKQVRAHCVSTHQLTAARNLESYCCSSMSLHLWHI